MNERAMQFQIGIFAIVAGLVLSMLIVWFGERPGLLRTQTFVAVHFAQAPGVTVGVPVRRSGLRIGEVAAVDFDVREGHDGVVVTFALDKDPRVLESARPKIARSLMGDVSIELVPDREAMPLVVSQSPQEALENPIGEGDSPVDPSAALETAVGAMNQAGETLASLKLAADQIRVLAKKADEMEGLLMTIGETGKAFTLVANDVHRVISTNEEDFRPAVTNFRQVVEKVNFLLDEETQTDFRTTMHNLNSATTKMDMIATSLQPLARDLGADPRTSPPATGTGQLVARMNRIAYDVSLLTDKLYDPQGGPNRKGGLNMKGSLQRLVTTSDLHDNLNGFATSAQDVFSSARPVVHNLREFTGKIANNPSELSRGALRP
jgi:phospholipid/cholesterol/gamma-HCH transport system substrate-binding protein